MASVLPGAISEFVTAATIADTVIDVTPDQKLSDVIAQKRDVTLRLAGGTYRLDEPLLLTPENARLRIVAKEGETPILSGGRTITGWRNGTFNGRDCFAADVPGVKKGKWFFRQLWIDGRRATRARLPNRGYFNVKESPDATDNWEVGQSRFRFNESDVPPGPFSYGAEAVLGTRWVESRLPIVSVDADLHIVNFTRKSQWRTEPNDPYFLEGDGPWMDEPGEWFLDRESGTIYYLPLPGQTIEKIDVIAPVLTHLVELRGDVEKKAFVEDVLFGGVTFAHTEWMHPDAAPATTQPISGGFVQAAVPLIAAVHGQGLRHVVFERCTFRNLGTWALELGRSTQNARVVQCAFRDLGGGGIKLGDGAIRQGDAEQTFGNQIIDCEVAGGGQMFSSAVGIWLGQGFDNRIAHNDIHDLLYSGISVGWTWGYETSLNRGNVVEKNRIHHIGTRASGEGPLLADMGAIYLLGGRQGTVVRDNVIHDVHGLRLGWGIYLDEGCSNVIVERNLVYRTTHGGFHLHYGRDNLVRNNIFALGRDWQVYRSREEEHVGFRFEKNIVHWQAFPSRRPCPLTQGGGNKVKFAGNLYGGIAPADFRVGELTWKTWRAAGQDEKSLFADPMFTDSANDDYTLKPGSPAEKIGFEPLDITTAGRRQTR
ncbi:MAG: right-handed parallel beta-helix repeat-containing protein [Tepidisphaeraceae bacterium]